MGKYICSCCKRALASRQSLRYHEQRRFPCKTATSTIVEDIKTEIDFSAQTVGEDTKREIDFSVQPIAEDTKTEIEFNVHQAALQTSFDSCKKKMLSVIGRCFVHYRKDSMVVHILCDLITLVEDIYLIDAEGRLSNETVQDITTNMLKQMYISKLMQMELQMALNNLLYLRESVKNIL